ncbi:DUF308 domain-containing protein [Haloarculaceae archaeon H-GB2-1]|nr:DUF308 domain-containing protein [Haloarculaceae archaeon H-GB11]MEA5409849.1 DUF308 domain-containing protein [Haloarculaceae archaeon H-GB2-1]
MANPVVGLATLTILLIAYFIFSGFTEIALGLQMRSDPRWVWPIVSGLISLLLAGLLWVGWPSSALWSVGLLFGASLLSTGMSLMLVANSGRTAAAAGEGERPRTSGV